MADQDHRAWVSPLCSGLGISIFWPDIGSLSIDYLVMKRNLVILVLGIALLYLAIVNGVFGGASSCTPATCGSNPVLVYFPYNNCSGEPQYVPIFGENGVCVEGNYRAWDNESLSDYYSYTHVDDICDPSLHNVSYSLTVYKFGSCMRQGMVKRDEGAQNQRRFEFSSMLGSYMYLLNVNASFESPQIFENEASVPAYIEDYKQCYSENNCTSRDGAPALQWDTYHLDYNCENPMYSSSNQDAQFGECLKFHDTAYVKSFCFDEHTSYFVFYEDAACTRPNSYDAYRRVCSNNFKTTSQCLATPTPFPSLEYQPIPTSSPTPISSTSYTEWNISLISLSVILVVLSL